MSIVLGKTYKDRITGFKGICTGTVQYLTGCNQALIVPKKKPDGTGPDGCWYDLQRLEEVVGTKEVSLDNGKTPGCDIQAPLR